MSPAKLPSGISLRIVPRPLVRLSGIRIRTNIRNASQDIKQLWDTALPHMNELSPRKHETAAYGVSWVVDAKTCSFDYCAAINPGKDCVLPEEFEETIIPAGLYAECTLSSREALYGLYHYLYYEWLPMQDESIGIGDTPCYEYYSDNGPGDGHMKLYIPVVGT
jgi:predicted transcriptional regulator YdeE